ncbi:hypothetical protein LU604_00170 [Erwinia tracheiphila]|uniref:Uncharacterized protein n=1 Tax=Erwinia tracheiphila TaxID=65700 RepID=A0A345CW66_9GAMM|nr:hypothetical protein [Erwinia tracheiphila]AXF77683.1 hypothetical protein AV903_19190 [Erwinia tracheiphila]UIA83630.1 hypothetical protein LU604_00170 [Erwinia tracheiphila]UIA92214.1 hypothetical protein LU632_00170 [Erwinia tracheiphila]
MGNISCCGHISVRETRGHNHSDNVIQGRQQGLPEDHSAVAEFIRPGNDIISRVSDIRAHLNPLLDARQGHRPFDTHEFINIRVAANRLNRQTDHEMDILQTNINNMENGSLDPIERQQGSVLSNHIACLERVRDWVALGRRYNAEIIRTYHGGAAPAQSDLAPESHIDNIPHNFSRSNTIPTIVPDDYLSEGR